MKKYKAFISYSHRDSKWGEWLHKSLETYRVPKTVVGTHGRDGKISQRVGVIFRDREELPTSHNLSEAILSALKDSQYLIVICSPNSAKSKWVNQEIIEFKKMNGEDKILALVVDGEPNATERNLPDNEAFPPALRYQLNLDETLSNQRVEPIAADTKKDGDGKENAKLKLLAGLLGIGFDNLKQREKRRRTQRLITISIVTLTTLVIFGILLTELIDQGRVAETAKQAEQQQRDIAQNLKEKWIQEGSIPPPLIDAILINDITAAEKALSEGGELNQQWGKDKLTPLMIACQVGHTQMVDWLLTKGASPLIYDRIGLAAIHHAAAAGQANLFDIFAQKKLNLDEEASGTAAKDWRPIDIAAEAGHVNVIKKLLDLGVSIELDTWDSDSNAYQSPIFVAAWSGRTNVIQALLDAGARTDIKDQLGRFPYDTAIQNGQDESAALLAKASGLEESGLLGQQLFQAVLYFDEESPSRVEDLLSKGADANYIDQESGTSVLARALRAPDAQNKQFKPGIIEKLLEAGANPNIQVIDEPAIIHEVKYGDVSILKLLINAGADLSLKDRYGRTSLDNAIELGNEESIQLLSEAARAKQ